MYENGLGTLQDFILAHIWFNIAAASGEKTAAACRDRLAQEMTLSDVSQAQRRARIWLETDFAKCEL
jgi:TPR repeat protein